jgi:hypothetical protein
VRLAPFCTPCTSHPCSNCSETYQEAHFIASFPYMQAELVFSCTAKKNGAYFKFCSWTFFKHAQLHISCIATPQQCTWTFVTYYPLVALAAECSQACGEASMWYSTGAHCTSADIAFGKKALHTHEISSECFGNNLHKIPKSFAGLENKSCKKLEKCKLWGAM